jgi:pyruvate/2-oxoglutarate/acetoin dehydrogenase E1 component
MKPLTYLEALRGSLHALMEEDPAVVVLGEDVLDPYGGAFKVTRGLSTRFPGRVLTTPICEATMVGLGVGAALGGLRPIVEIMFGDFLTLACDQIVNHAVKYQEMYGCPVAVPLVIRTPMGGGRGYGPTHSQSLEKLFLGVPGLGVVSPSLFHDPGTLLRRAVRGNRVVLFIEHKLLYPQCLMMESTDVLGCHLVPEVSGFPTAVIRNYQNSTPDVTLIAYGGVSRLLPPLLVDMAREEIRVEACLPAGLQPLPVSTLVSRVRHSRRAVVIEEGTAGYDWGAEVSTQLHTHLWGILERPVVRVGSAPAVVPASRPAEQQTLVSRERICTAIMEVLQ